jgi:EmrB/QacA subfamily drug resistance transporter
LTHSTTTAAAVDPRARLQIFFAVLLGLFLAALDQTVVGTALPRIVTDLHGNDIYTWAFTGYLLTATVSGPIYGKLSDLFGRRPILLFAIALFLVGSALCGQAREMWQFVAFRSLQGLGSGALFPVALAVIGDLFEPRERGKYQGFFGAMFGVSSLIGPAIGGVITDTVGWPWVFYVNLPIGFVVFAVIWRLLPRIRSAERPRIDYVGAALLVAALVPILIGLTNKQSAEWTDATVGGLIALGLVISAIFVAVEMRVAEPIIPLGLFRVRSFTVAVLAMFVVAMAFFTPIVFLPRWFQFVAGASATQSGYQILALIAGLIVAATTSGQIVARTGRYKPIIVAAAAILALGMFLLSGLRTDTPLPLLYVWMFITGLGVGPMFAVLTLVVQAAVPPRRIGTATASLTLFQQIGGSVGLAITGTLFTSRILEEIPRQLSAAGIPAQIAAGFTSSGTASLNRLTTVGDLGQAILAGVPPAVRPQLEPLIPQIVEAIHRAFTFAIDDTFTFGAVAGLLALVTLLFLRELPLTRPGTVEQGSIPAEAAPGALATPIRARQ